MVRCDLILPDSDYPVNNVRFPLLGAVVYVDSDEEVDSVIRLAQIVMDEVNLKYLVVRYGDRTELAESKDPLPPSAAMRKHIKEIIKSL